jgi:hypothetical protein
LSLDSSVASATASIKSFLLISTVLVGWEGVGLGWTLGRSVVPGPIFQPPQGQPRGETTLKDHCRQAETEEKPPILRAKLPHRRRY